MTTKHTPGPWARSGISIMAQNCCIATCDTQAACSSDEIDEANARLIATAPDLLEAASWARDILVQLLDAGHNVEIELNACERAIAKAEGRE